VWEDISIRVREFAVMIPPLLLALTAHEYAHAWTANKLGDPTARAQGRLTLNPLAHLDPVGTLALLFFRFGWAKPVPVNHLYFNHPRRDLMWVALAGPLTNLGLAAVSGLILRMFGGLHVGPGVFWLVSPLVLMLRWSVIYNVVLAIFNIIPIPPLDGGRVLSGLLPPRQAATYSRIEPYGMVLLLLLILTGAVGIVMAPPINLLITLLL
jgi:Zn-dependent protease